MNKKSTYPSNGGFAQILGIFFLVGALFAVVAAINNKNITFNPNKRADSIYPTTPPTPNPTFKIPNDIQCYERCYEGCESGLGLNGYCRSCEYYNSHKRSSDPPVECPSEIPTSSIPNGSPCYDNCYSGCQSGVGLKGICQSCGYYNSHNGWRDIDVECPPPWENGVPCKDQCYLGCESGTGLKGVCQSCEYYNSHKRSSDPPVECP